MSVKYPKPPIVTRTEWGCPDGQLTTHGSLSYTTVTHLIVHHTVNDNNSVDWPAVVRSIWRFHIFDRGYADIGYNYLIDPEGIVYEGRAGGDNVQGAHFSGVNGNTMGVAMLGEFTSIAPSVLALASLKKILAWKSDQRDIDPTADSLHVRSGLTLKNISGHRDGPSSTECPGNALYAFLPMLRADVNRLITDVGTVTGVSAASYMTSIVANDSIVAVFGSELAASVYVATTTPLPLSLEGTTVLIRDSIGIERYCGLFYVSPQQINLLLPSILSPGTATFTVTNAEGKISAGEVIITPVAPGLFSANADGKGVASAVVLRVKSDGSQVYEPVAAFDQVQSRFVPIPIDMGPAGDQVFLIVFGTGIRYRSSLSGVSAKIGGIDSQVLYAGPTSEYAGLDQVNLRLSRGLSGRGDVDIDLIVDRRQANLVGIKIR